METIDKPVTREIAHTGTRALASRSSALVARGLRDLARDSNWLIKKVFTGHSQQLAISTVGKVCAISQYVHHGTAQVGLYDIELSTPTMALVVPGGTSGLADSPAAFSWSPDARFLIGSWNGWPAGLHVFDLQGKLYLGKLSQSELGLANLAWSDSGDYFVATSRGKRSLLRIWGPRGGAPGGGPSKELGTPDWIEPQQAGEEFAEEGSF